MALATRETRHLTLAQILTGLVDQNDREEVCRAINVVEREIRSRHHRLVTTERTANLVMIDIGVLRSLHAMASDLYAARFRL